MIKGSSTAAVLLINVNSSLFNQELDCIKAIVSKTTLNFFPTKNLPSGNMEQGGAIVARSIQILILQERVHKTIDIIPLGGN